MTIGQDPDRFRHDDPVPVAMTAPARRDRSARWVAGILGVVALVVGVWLVATRLPGWLTRPEGTASTATDETVAAGTDARRIQATLFYVSDDGTLLVPTSRTVAYGATPVDQARHLVDAQVAAPPDGLVSPIALGTTVRAVFLSDRNEAYVDLGGAIATGHPGGSLGEALTVYAIVNAITVNLPEITGVQILVEGREVDSLRGHIDLRAPLARATDWIQKGPTSP